MKVIRAAEAVSGGDVGGPESFTGRVNLNSIARLDQAAGVSVVRFQGGAHTHWHTHEGGQVLHVLSGAGRVQADGGEVEGLQPGDFVVAEPGEKHWHGAAEGSDMAHISIAVGAVEWFAPVS